MAILNNRREIKDWLVSQTPSHVPEWQIKTLIRGVSAQVAHLVPPAVIQIPRTSQESDARKHASNESLSCLHGEEDKKRVSKTSPLVYTSAQTAFSVSAGTDKTPAQNPPLAARTDLSAGLQIGSLTYNSIGTGVPDSSRTGPASYTSHSHSTDTHINSRPQPHSSVHQKASPLLNFHSHQKTPDLSRNSSDVPSDVTYRSTADRVLHNHVEALDDADMRDGIEFLEENLPPKAQRPIGGKRPLEPARTALDSTSTQKKKDPYSIIDTEKLGLASLLDKPMFKEPPAKRPRFEPIASVNNFEKSPPVRGTSVVSQLTKLSSLSKTSLLSNLPVKSPRSTPAAAFTADNDVAKLQNFIRLCEAKIELLQKRNVVHDSSSLSLDAKTLWVQNKFEPRMKALCGDIDLIRPYFTFLKPLIHPKTLLVITSDSISSQSPPQAPLLVNSSPVRPVRETAAQSVFEGISHNTVDPSVEHRIFVSDSLEAETVVVSLPPKDIGANIEEARRVVGESRARVAGGLASDDELEDDFGGEYLCGLVSTQESNADTDLSGFVVSDGEGHEDGSFANETYVVLQSVQGTQQDSELDEGWGGELSEIEPPEPIEQELQELFLGDEAAALESPVAIDISDDESGVGADFTSQLNENRDEIVHIPSQNELDEDNFTALRELLHVKIEQSQRTLPQVVSDSDFSDDDDELLQLTKNALPESGAPDRRVIPGSEPFIDEIYAVLHRSFGLESFRPNQLEAVVATLQGRDVFVLLPTGGGKSLCFQLPALVKGGKTCGVTVVVSPLILLMQDQVQHLQEKGIRAGMISSKGSTAERNETFKALTSGQLDLVYLSPEMINNSGRVQKIASKLHENDMLARVVVDEAHCVSSWGHDFRPDYKGLKFFKENFPNVPVMALTATASEKVCLDIIHNLQMRSPVMLKLSFNRVNLFYTVMNKPPAIYEWIRNYIHTSHRGETGIIYCHSKQSCETTAEKLNECGISCMYYHAGMDPDERLDVQLQWQHNRAQLICATIAFGMGIDKPDVRFVIHMYIPRSLEGYYQETGRAGRDGKPSECIMFYSYRDARSLQSLILRDQNLEEPARDAHLAKLRQVVQYCENKTDCRRRQVLHFFNETFDAKNCHRMCDNCRSDTVSVAKDVTEHCINIIKMVQLMQHGKVTVLYCQDVFKGARTKKILSLGHDDNPYYGAGKQLDRGDIERIFFELQSLNGLAEYQVMKGGFASTYVRLGSHAHVLLKGQHPITLSFAQNTAAGSASRARLVASGNGSRDYAGNRAGLESFRCTDSFVSARDYKLQEEQEKDNMHWPGADKTAVPPAVFRGSSDGGFVHHALAELRKLRQLVLLEKGFARANYYVSDALLEEMAAKLPTNVKDFGKLQHFDKTQPSCFPDFKKLLAALARARKGTSSQKSASSTLSPFFKQSGKRGTKKAFLKSRSQNAFRPRGSSRHKPASSRSSQPSKRIRLMPL